MVNGVACVPVILLQLPMVDTGSREKTYKTIQGNYLVTNPGDACIMAVSPE